MEHNKGKIERGFKIKIEKQGNAWAIHKKYRQTAH